MSLLRHVVRPRTTVLTLLWALPVLFYIVLGAVALWQLGWLRLVMWVLPLLWVVAWVVAKLWKGPKLQQTDRDLPFDAPEFWTPNDRAGMRVVDQFRGEVDDVDRMSIADPHRYINDAQALMQRLALHYHADRGKDALHPLTPIEILAVVHLAVEDLENWLLENVPGSDLATIGQLERIPNLVRAFDLGQTLLFLGSSVLNPARLLTYPMYRGSGKLTKELQDQVVRVFYQQYLRQVGYYMIEMYSGRLTGGSRRYRKHFSHIAGALHATGGDTVLFDSARDIDTSIAVMGQVKAGKSSLINALMKDEVAETSVLPETREVQQFEYPLPGSDKTVVLLDTPGYSEANVTKRQQNEIQTASESADILLLVMAANISARDPDVQVVRGLQQHYEQRRHLRAPPIIAVLTHIDRLRPVREWSPPYDWREPDSEKEKSIAAAVDYLRELFGDSIAGYACVYTGDEHSDDASVADELVPLLIDHLDHGHATAILKAFYKRLSAERLARLKQQTTGLVKQVVRHLLD